MKNLNLVELVELRTKMILEGKDVKEINYLIESKEEEYSNYLLEGSTGGPGGAVTSSAIGTGGGGVAYGNTNIGGSGDVRSSQPSSFAGVTTEPGYSAGGGKSGTDIGVPYNAGGTKMFQKVPVDNRRGSNKRRKNKMIAGLKQSIGKKIDFTYGEGGAPKSGKIMSFDNFKKDSLSKVTKIKQ